MEHADDDSRQPLVPKENSLKRRTFRHSSSSNIATLPSTEPKSPNPDNIPSIPQPVPVFQINPPNFKHVFIYLAIYLTLGTLCFYLVRDQIKGTKTNGIIDAIYFCTVTMTTVGYGDLVPETVLTKLLACAFVFTGMAIVGTILSKAADYLVEKQEIFLAKTMHMYENIGPNEIVKEDKHNHAKYKFLLAASVLTILIPMGVLVLIYVENKDPIDAFYCVCATITTLGYGDESFSTLIGRVFAVFWILSSTICLAQFFLYVAEYNAEKRQKEFVKWVLTKRVTFSDLEAADLDQDHVVSSAEFVILKLKELGKISQEDISPLMKRFYELDVDDSGTLTPSDLSHFESSAN